MDCNNPSPEPRAPTAPGTTTLRDLLERMAPGRRPLLLTMPLWLGLAGCPAEDPGAEAGNDVSGDPTPSTGQPSETTTGEPDTNTDTGPAATTTGPGDSGTTTSAVDDSTTTNAVGSTTTFPGSCGNNIIEDGELCDLAQLNGETCESLGFEGGNLGCLLTCEDYNLLGCFICGNEVIDLAEDCEGSVPKEVTCVSLGFQAGEITCGRDCQYDLSECSICGDGIQQGPEECDGIDFDGQTCVTLGFDGGNLGCNLQQCAFVTTGCEGPS